MIDITCIMDLINTFNLQCNYSWHLTYLSWFKLKMSSRTHFGVVDQAMKSMKTVEEYIKVGMETTLDVGMDFVEHDKGNS